MKPKTYNEFSPLFSLSVCHDTKLTFPLCRVKEVCLDVHCSFFSSHYLQFKSSALACSIRDVRNKGICN